MSSAVYSTLVYRATDAGFDSHLKTILFYISTVYWHACLLIRLADVANAISISSVFRKLYLITLNMRQEKALHKPPIPLKY